uniref:DUF819 domain-containing protein n=1 Tax=Rhodosorus marinus TaxID=101924 RepID=A0A7S0BM01_9RHOD|mmetsp:Transcript_2270/g.3355  ORF Transcript_2270/g.3355 Transcript_2270/m.3355 type:complete len:430 (+) Transcript_2270:91-1380(+)
MFYRTGFVTSTSFCKAFGKRHRLIDASRGKARHGYVGRRSRCRTMMIQGLGDPVGQIWLTLAVMFSASTAGIVGEKTKLGGHVSAPLITMLLTILASEAGVIPSTSAVYDVTNRYIVPIAIPMLLYEADLRKILRTSKSMLIAFACGLIATVAGTLAAWAIVPLNFGAEDWKIAAGLCARHIGGALNLVAVSEVTRVDPSILTAVIAADNMIVFLYFLWLFVASRAQNRVVPVGNIGNVSDEEKESDTEDFAKAVSMSAVICILAKVIAANVPFPAGIISTSSFLIVCLVTAAPQVFRPLAQPGSIVGVFLLQVFFAASGATGSIGKVFQSAPQLMVWSAVQLFFHFLVLVGLGRLGNIDRAMLYVASNANVGGPTTAAAMASAMSWRDLIVPGILVGILGYATATILSLGLGSVLLRISATSGFLVPR